MNVRRSVAPDVDMLGTFSPVPRIGHLPLNAFFLRSREPMLVDLGVVNMHEPMLRAVESLLDPVDLRYIYFTHADGDHVGCLDTLLPRAPNARIVTTFLGMLKLRLSRPIPPERFHLVNPGQELDVGDRRLLVVKPPCYDAPETTMLFDPSTGTLFSSDYFGALIPTPVDSADAIPEAALRTGIGLFLAIDVPWVRDMSLEALARGASAIGNLRPERILGAHLPPARDMIDALTDHVLAARDAPPFVGPDQAAFEQILRGVQGGSA
jgi:glyoxylase-like metal-dependent hydrolase (beta-lactamase superfamily II)